MPESRRRRIIREDKYLLTSSHQLYGDRLPGLVQLQNLLHFYLTLKNPQKKLPILGVVVVSLNSYFFQYPVSIDLVSRWLFEAIGILQGQISANLIYIYKN